MHSMRKMIAELHAMLKLHEKGISKKAETPIVLAIRGGKIQKDKMKPQGAKGKAKGKNKLAYAPKTKIPPPPKRDNPAKDSIFHHCIFTIELYAFSNNTWVYDTGCETHICNTSQGVRRSRKLKHGVLSIYMCNGIRAGVKAIRSFDLILPSSLIIDNCHFAPTISRGVVSISRLVKNGYIHTFTNYGISVSKDNVFYFNAIPRDDIYEIDMHNLYPNVSSNYNVSNKRAKHGLDSYYLWHCHLGHINKKRMDMLQRNGLLQPTHDESHEKCKSCISGKMESKPFLHLVERAKDLLGLICTDVCGPFRTMSREGANYFITFTNDFSRYGFVYLMKHKNEVFETFKGYALETAARILNMVPTKKVDRTPYEIWHGKAPNFMVQEASGKHRLLEMSRSDKGIEIIQEEDTQPSENTSKEHNEVAPIEKYELGDLDEPPNYKAALADPESDKWLEAMNTEMQSMKDNQVWILVELPPNGRTVGSKWLFKKKTDMDGNVHTFKARLVAKGYTQTYRVDYGKTFSPVAYIRAIRILLAIYTFYDYEIWQIDVKTTFLNGHLSEDVYMVQPKGFVDPKHPNKVCKLQCIIYGLKQASRSWNKRFDDEIKKIGFTQNPDKPCVYLKASGSNVAFLVLYVDDILLMGNSITMMKEVKSWLCKCFYMKDLGEATYILGIKIICDRSKRLIALSQSAYLEKILKKFRMENSKKGYTPMIEKPDYRKFNNTVVKTILKYLRNTKDMVLVYGAKPEDELKKSTKQSTTAMSSTEAEYIVADEASREAVWIRKFIDGLGGVMPSNKRPMEMLCDNEHALPIASDSVADPFTKPVPFNKHFEHAMAIEIVPANENDDVMVVSGIRQQVEDTRRRNFLFLLDLKMVRFGVNVITNALTLASSFSFRSSVSHPSLPARIDNGSPVVIAQRVRSHGAAHIKVLFQGWY
ncbi:retrotransposon protein, putative, ty1-copia subclass [Tanacetum coccineum]